MFGKKKIELNGNEIRIITHALINFRNDLIKQNQYTDALDDVLPHIKNKLKADKYSLGVIINSLDFERKAMLNKEDDTAEIDDLLLRLLDIHKTL